MGHQVKPWLLSVTSCRFQLLAKWLKLLLTRRMPRTWKRVEQPSPSTACTPRACLHLSPGFRKSCELAASARNMPSVATNPSTGTGQAFYSDYCRSIPSLNLSRAPRQSSSAGAARATWLSKFRRRRSMKASQSRFPNPARGSHRYSPPAFDTLIFFVYSPAFCAIYDIPGTARGARKGKAGFLRQATWATRSQGGVAWRWARWTQGSPSIRLHSCGLELWDSWGVKFRALCRCGCQTIFTDAYFSKYLPVSETPALRKNKIQNLCFCHYELQLLSTWIRSKKEVTKSSHFTGWRPVEEQEQAEVPRVHMQAPDVSNNNFGVCNWLKGHIFPPFPSLLALIFTRTFIKS